MGLCGCMGLLQSRLGLLSFGEAGNRKGHTCVWDCTLFSSHGAATRGVYGDYCGVPRTGMAWFNLVCWLFVLI